MTINRSYMCEIEVTKYTLNISLKYLLGFQENCVESYSRTFSMHFYKVTN